MSNPLLANTIPVKPPRVNKNIKPTANNIGVRNSIEPPHIVAIQLKILIPVGTAIIMVAAVKYARVNYSMCFHTDWTLSSTFEELVSKVPSISSLRILLVVIGITALHSVCEEKIRKALASSSS